MDNYFNYFTEVEEHFHRRRGSTLLLSTLDWALIETWKDAGIPLEAVLRGIDATFDRYQNRPARPRKINSLAYCSQEVLAAAEDMKESVVGAQREGGESGGLSAADIGAFLAGNAARLEELASAGEKPEGSLEGRGSVGSVKELPGSARPAVEEAALTLRELAENCATVKPSLEDLERRLTVMEEKLLAVLLAATTDNDLLAARAEADRELAPYRRKMPAAQIDQLQRQFVHKRLLEQYGLPRLSLFYM